MSDSSSSSRSSFGHFIMTMIYAFILLCLAVVMFVYGSQNQENPSFKIDFDFELPTVLGTFWTIPVTIIVLVLLVQAAAYVVARHYEQKVFARFDRNKLPPSDSANANIYETDMHEVLEAVRYGDIWATTYPRVFLVSGVRLGLLSIFLSAIVFILSYHVQSVSWVALVISTVPVIVINPLLVVSWWVVEWDRRKDKKIFTTKHLFSRYSRQTIVTVLLGSAPLGEFRRTELSGIKEPKILVDPEDAFLPNDPERKKFHTGWIHEGYLSLLRKYHGTASLVFPTRDEPGVFGDMLPWMESAFWVQRLATYLVRKARLIESEEKSDIQSISRTKFGGAGSEGFDYSQNKRVAAKVYDDYMQNERQTSPAIYIDLDRVEDPGLYSPDVELPRDPKPIDLVVEDLTLTEQVGGSALAAFEHTLEHETASDEERLPRL